MQKGGWVYMITDRPDGTLYIGVTADLVRRISEHRTAERESFTQRYWIRRLVYFERYEDVRDAILREKQMKKWRRAWKVELIIKDNPAWDDLYERIL